MHLAQLVVQIYAAGGLNRLGRRARGGLKGCADAVRSPRAYLVVVVIGQTLAVESHPPPLKNTVSAKRRDAQSARWARSPQQSGAKTSHSKNQTVGRRFPEQVLIFHQDSH